MVQLLTSGAWRSMPGFGSSSRTEHLDRDLKLATEGSTIDVPDTVLLAIVQATHHENDRRTIMRHLAACLNEPASKRWRRVYLAIHVVEHLLQRGSPELISETVNGHHFDLVQRMSFLEQFMFPEDERVQSLIRRKASAARSAYAKLQTKEAEGSFGTSTRAPPARPDGAKKGGAVARHWHSDDTTDDESGGEDDRVQRHGIARPKLPLEDNSSTDSDSTKSPNSTPTFTCANQSVVSDSVSDQVAFSDLLGEVGEVPTGAVQSVMSDPIRGQAALPDLLGEAGEVNLGVSNTSGNLLDF